MTTPSVPAASSAARTAQALFETSTTADEIHNREVSFPPEVGYHSIPSHVFDRYPMGLELQHASNEDLSGLMAALPQWNLDPSPDAVDPKPWRVIWAYHPVMNTWGSGSRTCPKLSKFQTPEDLGTEILSELPTGFDEYEPSVLIYPLYRIIAYHTVQSIRYKLANFLEHHLSQRELVPYFQDLKAHNRGPVPDVPQVILDRIRQGDARALQVMQGHAKAYNSFELVKYCTKAGVPPPPDKPQGPPAKSSPPITDANFPALPKASAAPPAEALPQDVLRWLSPHRAARKLLPHLSLPNPRPPSPKLLLPPQPPRLTPLWTLFLRTNLMFTWPLMTLVTSPFWK